MFINSWLIVGNLCKVWGTVSLQATLSGWYISVFQWQILVCASYIYIVVCQYSCQEESHTKMRNSGPFLPFRLSFPTRTKYCVWLLLDFSKGRIVGECDLRLLTHRFPTRIRGRLDLSPVSPSPTLPFPHLLNIRTQDLFLRNWPSCFWNKTYVTFRLKKKTRWNDQPCLFECEEHGTSLTLTSSVYICQVPNLINYQSQTLGYQQLIDKIVVLSTVGW